MEWVCPPQISINVQGRVVMAAIAEAYSWASWRSLPSLLVLGR
ncbi:MAG: hypothetical protein ACKPCM_15040 [Pseudanabaena sp.]